MIPSNFSALAILALLVLALSGIYLKFKTRIASRFSRPLAIFLIVSLVTAGGGIVSAQVVPNPLTNITSLPTGPNDPDRNPPLLANVPVPKPSPSQLAIFVADGQENIGLLQLGKSLFWDQQLGSDGIQSCATCHVNAGADSRSKNQLSPGLKAVPPDVTFLPNGPNYQLKATDFPFHRLQDPNKPPNPDPNDPNFNPVTFDTNDVTSSQGVFNTFLVRTTAGDPTDEVKSVADPNGFQVNGINVRRGEPRNTPTVINAIFNKLQFWDGRAKETFNGVNGQGIPNPKPEIPIYKALGLTQITPFSDFSLDNSSMASLVTEPPLSENELSAAGRTLPQIGAKFFRKRGQLLKSLRPLGKQLVALDDSVLGPVSRFPNKGLLIGAYDRLIRQTFKPEWWRSNLIIETDKDGIPTVTTKTFTTTGNSEEGLAFPPNQFSLRDWNFSLFAGLAVQKYISTLVAGDTPFDQFQQGDTSALTQNQQKGLALFVGATDGLPATPTAPAKPGNTGANCNTCHTIPEFTRASVRRAGISASLAIPPAPAPALISAANGFFNNFGVRPAANDPGASTTPGVSTFKAPTLRNIGLTAPYMHNGGMATLEQVVQFYNRGRSDQTRPGGQPIVPGATLGLEDEEQKNLVDFLRNGLTDERVRLEKAPFDHPELFIPNGHPGNEDFVTARGNDGFPQATDVNPLVRIPQVGRNGLTVAQKKFLE